jgi:hypothetical protein
MGISAFISRGFLALDKAAFWVVLELHILHTPTTITIAILMHLTIQYIVPELVMMGRQ